jgi:hypothetical protein
MYLDIDHLIFVSEIKLTSSEEATSDQGIGMGVQPMTAVENDGTPPTQLDELAFLSLDSLTHKTTRFLR